MSMFYLSVGIDHFIRPEWYQQIVPPFLPFKYQIVLISGLIEIILGSLLPFAKTRYIASFGLILLLITVYPANIYLALTHGAALGTTPLIAWGRLPIQFVLIGIAYWHSK
mgnify:CR=1 FL=1